MLEFLFVTMVKILDVLHIIRIEKTARIFILSRGGTLFNVDEALRWANENIKGAISHIAHGTGGPVLCVHLPYYRRRELRAAVKALKARYKAPLHFNTSFPF